MPRSGPKRLPGRQHRLNSSILEVHSGSDDIIAPPRRRVDVIEGECEEDSKGSESETEVEAGGREEVEAAPPAEVALLDKVLEDEADDAPGQVVERRGGRNGAGAAEDDGRDQVADGRLRPLFGGEVEDDGDDGADAKEDEQTRVDLARGENPRGSEETPDDGSWVSVSTRMETRAG